MYVTPTQLADGADASKELAELFGVEPSLLSAVIAGGDTSAWPPQDIDRAEAVLASIDRACALATSEADSRLGARGYAVPMDAARFPVLTVWARAIARYHLNRNRDRTDEDRGRIERDYREALRALDLVAAGKLSLGAGDPLTAAAADDGAIRVTSEPRAFSRRTLGAL